jgi:hypothetical protein
MDIGRVANVVKIVASCRNSKESFWTLVSFSKLQGPFLYLSKTKGINRVQKTCIC